jgi:hypothetical protein
MAGFIACAQLHERLYRALAVTGRPMPSGEVPAALAIVLSHAIYGAVR